MNYKRRSRKNENWISYKVNQELKVEKSSFYKNLKTFILEMSIPSNKSFILILVLSITIILLIHIERVFSILQINNDIVLRNATFLLHQIDNQDLLTALAGISSIIFGLLIFISGQKDEYVKRILLRESYLYPLSVTTILFFLIFIFGDVNVLGFFPILIIGLLTVNATAKILLHYLNEKKFTEKKKYLLKNDLVESIKLEMKKIIAKKHIISNRYLDVIQYESRSKSNKDTTVLSKKSGIIVDINIKKLEQIIANKTSNQKPKLKIRNLFDVITPEENISLIDRDYNVMFTKKDKKIIESAFEIKPLSPFYKDFDIRIFQFLQMPYIKAIQNKIFFEIENFRELHIELIEYISQTIISIKNISDKDKDMDKDYEIFLKLFKDLNEALFREALLSHDKLIFNKVIQNSLIRNLIFSVNNKDKYLFNLFMDSIKYMFDFAYDIRIQREFKEFIHEQLLSYMKTDIAAIVQFSNGDLSDFFSEYCEIFKLIWKKAFDERDTKTFKEIVEKIFKNEIYIDAENFREKYQVMIFELISWNLYKFLNDKKKDVKLQEYYEYFQEFIDNLGILPKEELLVENLTKIYVSIYKNIKKEKETLLPVWYLYEKGIDDGLHAYEEEILDNITIFYIITLILNSYNVNETSKSYFTTEEHSDIQKRIEEIFNKISNNTNISKPYFIVKKYLQSKGVDI
jgi:hypothetical protein